MPESLILLRVFFSTYVCRTTEIFKLCLTVLYSNYLDDLNVTSVSDRKTLLESADHFTGSVEKCLKTITEAFASSDEKESEEQGAKFSGFPELLPTIGEEDELEEEETQSCEPLKSCTPVVNSDMLDKKFKYQCNSDDKGK